MKVECQKCHHKIDVPDNRLKAYGFSLSFPCLNCGSTININIKSKTGNTAGNTSDAGTKAGLTNENLPGTAELKQKVLSSVKDLPPMPQVAEKARKLTSDPDASFSDLAKLVETDQAIVTRVLKLANSALYGAVGKIASVQQASVVLGLKTLNELLTLACASGLLKKDLKGYDLQPNDMWKHSLAVAAGSKIIAEKKFPSKTDDVFSAGLIHDVGKLILDPYIFEVKQTYKKTLQENNNSAFTSEREALSFDHSEIGAAVCQMWRIPREITTAIRYHHEPWLSPEKDLAYVICAADMLAISIAGKDPGEKNEIEVDKNVLDFLGLKTSEVTKISEEVKDYTDKIISE